MAFLLNPYLNFNGNAREAFEFYRDVFGGELTVSTFGDLGAADGADADKVMHAALEIPGGHTLMGADVPGHMQYAPPAGFAVSVSGADDALQGYFEQLAAKGTITMPLQKQVWGDAFGMLTDQFGIPWMVNIQGSGQAG